MDGFEKRRQLAQRFPANGSHVKLQATNPVVWVQGQCSHHLRQRQFGQHLAPCAYLGVNTPGGEKSDAEHQAAFDIHLPRTWWSHSQTSPRLFGFSGFKQGRA